MPQAAGVGGQGVVARCLKTYCGCVCIQLAPDLPAAMWRMYPITDELRLVWLLNVRKRTSSGSKIGQLLRDKLSTLFSFDSSTSPAT